MSNLFKWRFAAQEPPPDNKDTDSYFEKLIKYIPADIVAAYVAIDGILKQGSNDPLWLTWAVFISLLALTPLYVCYMKTDPPGFVSSKTFHWVASTFAFAVWVFALGGPFAVTFAWYKPIFGSVLLILTTLLLPVLENACFKCPPGSQPPGNANPPNTNPTNINTPNTNTPNASPANTNTPNTNPTI